VWLHDNNLKPPQEVIQELENLLIPVSFDNGTALRTASSPQNNALNWLAINKNLHSYSYARKVQRYALASLFYSTNGTHWNETDEWMSSSNECFWYSWFASLCPNIRGSVETLGLWFNNLVGSIPNELALLYNLSKSSLVGCCCNDCVVMRFSLYSHACFSYSFYSLLGSLQQ
jgi:hypothetical protein